MLGHEPSGDGTLLAAALCSLFAVTTWLRSGGWNGRCKRRRLSEPARGRSSVFRSKPPACVVINR